MKFRKRSILSASLIATAVMFTGCGDFAGDDENLNNDKNNQIIHVEFSQEAVDSLFTELVDRTEAAVENEDDYVATAELDFETLATEFEKYAVAGDMKANLGYIVAEMMSLNKSQSLKKVADSLDVYFGSLYEDDSDAVVVSGGTSTENIRAPKSSERPERGDRVRGIASQLFKNRKQDNFVSNAYEKNGVNGLATALLVRAPEVILSRAESPSWPSFITVSYIQDAIDKELNPRIGKVLEALERVEDMSYDKSLLVSVDGENVEIDIADIYLLDASMRALRSSLLLFNSYEWDVYAPNTTNYTWIDRIIELDEEAPSSYYSYSLSGDTLVRTWNSSSSQNSEIFEYSYDLLKYNMERTGFASIRQSNHAQSYEDLLAVPQKLEKAIIALENETDNQEDDLVKKVDLNSLDEEMKYIPDDLVSYGFSDEFARNFATPRSLVNFVEEILSGPYRFNEAFDLEDSEGNVVDQASFDITVDISKFYTNPIEDFRDLLPYYKFRNQNNILEPYNYTYNYSYSYGSNTFYCYSYGREPEINIPEDMIESMVYDSYGDLRVTLKNDYYYTKDIDNYAMFTPFDFTDHNGNVISWEDMEIMLEEDGEIPYFKDYTLNGIFPGMSRDKWNNILKELYRL